MMTDFDIYPIDLRSDTVTMPTPSMMDAIAYADLGDDVLGEDPTILKLEEKIARILGKQSALFVPSGTMANLIAVMVHCDKRGAEILVGDKSHIFKYEQGGASQLAGVMVSTLENKSDGTFDLNVLRNRLRGADIHEPKTMMIAVENTHNLCGGKVLPVKWLDQLADMASMHSIGLHMDGARLFNASEYLGVDPASLVKRFDSISICFSKALCAPVGSALVGTSAFISAARRFRKVLGGGMRQSGILAAPCIVALDEIVPVLKEDHKRAKVIAQAILAMHLSTFNVDINNQQTNIIRIDVHSKSDDTSKLVEHRLNNVTREEIEKGITTKTGAGIIIKSYALSPTLLRLVTHNQISDEDVNCAIKKLTYVLKEVENNI